MTEIPTAAASFDAVADAYDRHRPAYPDRLVDRACELAGLRAGDVVLEVGCGTGQLTRSLVARGLRVTAVEPGERLIARARERLAGGTVEFVHARLEDARLPAGRFAAAFSASAIHWLDPDMGWQRIADALRGGGTIALLSYFGLDDPHTRADQQALREILAGVAPALAAERPAHPTREELRAGVAQRRHNISAAWAWLGSYDIAREGVSARFGEAKLIALPFEVAHTAGELNALLGTMSFWSRLSEDQREVLAAEHHALEQRLGRPIRSSLAACAITAAKVG